MVSALGLAGKTSQAKQKQHRQPQAGPAKEKKKEIDKKKRGVEGGKERNPKVSLCVELGVDGGTMQGWRAMKA